jgi:hypothetical protein
MARQGKIARLPVALRAELNARLLDGLAAGEILPWLNDLPEVQRVLKTHFASEPINDQNLSAWRLGGYADWLANREQVDATRRASEFALDLVRSGSPNLGDGAAAILAGKLLAQVESADDDRLGDLVKMVVMLRSGDHTKSKLSLDEKKAKLKGREVDLAESKMKQQTVAMFVNWAQSEDAQRILSSGQSKAVQMDLLHELMWGEKPK